MATMILTMAMLPLLKCPPGFSNLQADTLAYGELK